MTKELLSLPVEKVATLIKNKIVSPVDLTKALLNEIVIKDEYINAYISIREEQAIEDAKKAEEEIVKGVYRGMYHGVPIAIKDNIYVNDEVTTMGSKIHHNYIPAHNATVIEKLRKAGSVLIGKHNMHEYAWGVTSNNPHFGPVRNPWDLDKIPGGSSGGSAASVISNTTFASLGTDTGGSIRIPSSTCGTVGLKPTYGRVSNHGVFPLAWTLDHVGPITKTVKDAAGLLEVISGFDKNDPSSLHVPVQSYREHITGNVEDVIIGINEDYFFNDVDEKIEGLVRENIMHLIEMGATVKEISLPAIKQAEWAMYVTLMSEAATIHQTNHMNKKEDFGEDIQIFLGLGELPSAVDYVKAQQIRSQLKNDFHKAFQKVDVIIAPTLPITVPEIGSNVIELNGDKVDFTDHIIRFMGPANMTGIPALSVPCGFKDNLPVGLQIMGPAFDEQMLLNVGYAIEQTKPLEGRKPQFVFV